MEFPMNKLIALLSMLTLFLMMGCVNERNNPADPAVNEPGTEDPGTETPGIVNPGTTPSGATVSCYSSELGFCGETHEGSSSAIDFEVDCADPESGNGVFSYGPCPSGALMVCDIPDEDDATLYIYEGMMSELFSSCNDLL
jgi:hypothetical protein